MKSTINKKNYPYQQALNIVEDNYRTYYEVFLYSFYDSNNDGIGDINGLIEKLDYINDGNASTDSDLGFNGIWLMPIMPSDTYHMYDVKDYYGIDSRYGTIEDFKRLVRECNKRGIKLIIDLVINHTSSTHPWFLSALKSLAIEPCGKETCIHEGLCREHNPYVSYYNFMKGKPDAGNYYSTGVGDWYYEGAFSSNMPDLKLHDTVLRKEIEDIILYWLDMGIGGFRLDAALHYYSEDTEKNTEVIAWLNQFLKERNSEYYMVAEVWTNFSSFSKYYRSGIDSVFNFAFATETGIIVKTLNHSGDQNSGNAFGKAMLQVQEGLKKYSDTAMDAPFFTNHDTVRASGYFAGNSRKIKMAGGLNLLMSGSAFVYYGEEIGMSGSGRDENKRAPMYWSDTVKKGMTTPPKHMERVNHIFGSVEEQRKDSLSIYHYYKRAIRLRNENPEIARGEIELLSEVTDMDICALSKTYKTSKIFLLYNISEVEKEVTLKREIYKYSGIRGYLTTEGEEITLEGDTVVLPPYSIVVLK
ncbi:alpha-amylase [Anaerocolumna cellulosilytica]|uniref:Alpha-amylase n=1 Tax=Anaerocolumna cellulosilytica TaxID=433286 RepID=A0A6S6R0F8_9FIRM|nr:alpha-amylase family glycosyl hydrolase [Anaerocolumna cellulosilytica]MBB5196212.1 glycosidase [Anaerocolumna cellulosilytica]BCJ92468.1 alpha-amylase [Anaerocolumna cellulosilytica]